MDEHEEELKTMCFANLGGIDLLWLKQESDNF